MQTVKEVVTSLSQSFETKSQDMEKKLSHMSERLGKLEVATLRPMTDATLHEQEQKQVFRSFLARGDLEEKALSSTDEEGGYLIPQIIGKEINDVIRSESVMRQLATSLTISGDSIDLLVSKDEADGGWAGETEERNETNTPKLTKIKIPVHEMYAKPRATQKLLDDAKLDIETWIASKVASKMSRMENYAFIHGTGEKQPRGFLTYPLSYGTAEWGEIQAFRTGVAGEFPAENAIDILIDTVNSLKPQYLAGGKWLMSRSAVAAISKLKDRNGLPLWNADLNTKANATLLGYPVLICDDMPAINNEEGKPAIAFGNFEQAYYIIDRFDTRIMRDPYSAKPYIEFYTTRRVGGDVVNFEALKVITFTTSEE